MLLIVALLLTLGTGALFAYQDYQHAKDKETYQQVLKQATQKQSTTPTKSVKRPDPSKPMKVDRPTMKDLRDFSQTKAYQQAIANKIGSISIPDLELVVPIIQETTNTHLKAGATTYNDTKLGKGNFVLLGHNMGEKGILFSDIPTLKKGAKLNVTVGKQTASYHVIKKEVVPYTNGQAMLPTKKNQVTLITCDKGTATDYRVVITAIPTY
ncbi:Sortase (surface protein transpeptidase) [Listeria grayi]|uniref:Sortase (Surface protein transpeptidase) n=1 Tax=Listeria grayi TaxID=1641 RepID=A0A378MKB4_LISGR|nr:class A sortase [Listeria grayi]STY44205.1 Sortase (surface protein transpeptidase) [Listeria grayi]